MVKRHYYINKANHAAFFGRRTMNTNSLPTISILAEFFLVGCNLIPGASAEFGVHKTFGTIH